MIIHRKGLRSFHISGFYLKDDDIPNWISWFKWIVMLRYAFFSLVQNEFREGAVFGSSSGAIPNILIVEKIAGVPNSVNMWINGLITFCIGCFYRVLAFIGLKYLNRGLGLEG